MVRPWPIEYEGAYYHILSRGNEWVVGRLLMGSAMVPFRDRSNRASLRSPQ